MIKIAGLNEQEVNLLLPNRTILLGYVGSISHGTQINSQHPLSTDDKDIMGVAIGDMNVYLGLGKFEQKVVTYLEWDSVVYEIKKSFRLLLKQNPNVIGLLWLPEQNYIYRSNAGQLLILNRHLFSSKEIYHSFSGYAHGQLHRMTHSACNGYMGEKRKKLVAQFGYDCKNAAHLIRLLRMGIEFLTDGILQVHRKDAHELKAIKTGKWSLEKVQDEADKLFTCARQAYVNSTLPAQPQYEEAEALLIKIIRQEVIQWETT